MGCMLSAASCNKWLCEEILKTSDFAGEQKDITDEKLGENHVYFLPYLMGERSPINDTNARGTFTGMTMDTSRSDMVQAVLEGVAFAIRDSFEVAKSLGIEIPRSNICGGGAKSPLWRKIFANVLGIPLDMVKTEQGPGYGAAMLAMVGCGKFKICAGSGGQARRDRVHDRAGRGADGKIRSPLPELQKALSRTEGVLRCNGVSQSARSVQGRTTLTARRMHCFYRKLWQIRNIFRADRVVGPYSCDFL